MILISDTLLYPYVVFSCFIVYSPYGKVILSVPNEVVTSVVYRQSLLSYILNFILASLLYSPDTSYNLFISISLFITSSVRVILLFNL